MKSGSLKINIIFLSFFALILSYLISTAKGYNVHITVVVFLVLAMTGTVFYQIWFYDEKKSSEIMLVANLMLTAFCYSFICVLPHIGLFGHDPHWDYSVAYTISNYGWPIPQDMILERTVNMSEWPLLHILVVIVQRITSFNLLFVCKYIPSVISALTLVFFYLTARNCYKNKKAALFASLAFTSLFWHVFFHSHFVRETLAFMFFFIIVYLLSGKQSYHSKLLFVVLMTSIVFSHHLTCLMLIAFFALVMLAKFLLSQIDMPVKYISVTGSSRLVESSFTSFFFVIACSFFYWMYLGGFTFDVIKVLFDDFLKGGYGTYSLNHYFTNSSIRMMLGSYGNILFFSFFCILLLNGLVKNKKRMNMNDLIFLVWGGVIVLISYVSTTLIPRIEFSRFIIFGYAFILISASNLIVSQKKRLIPIFALFVVFQLFLIPPYIYNRSFTPEYNYGKYREYYLPEEYKAVSWFVEHSSSKIGILGDWTSFELFGAQQVKVDFESDKAVQVFNGDFNNIDYHKWIVLRNEDFFCARINKPRTTAPIAVLPDTYEKMNNQLTAFRTYDNKEVILYKLR